MDDRTRRQLLRISADFYRAHAQGFDASRGHQPWPGWARLLDSLPAASAAGPFRVLDVGCGNARLATFLADAGFDLDYIGVDANAALLGAARARLREELGAKVELIEADFLASATPGETLPPGPFDLIALFGVLHHVPGADWRAALVAALVERLRSTSASPVGGAARPGVLALAAWQFANRPRFDSKRVAWTELPTTLGESVNLGQLDAGDFLLRFGSDATLPPRYCHQVSDAEMERLGESTASSGSAVEVEVLDDYPADGGGGDLNRYRILRRR